MNNSQFEIRNASLVKDKDLTLWGFQKFWGRGFTLIELLVVLVIISAGISLVSPRLFAVYERIRASVEEQRLADVVEAVKMKAFLQQKPYSLHFEGSTLKINEGNKTFEFDIIQFQDTAIIVNENGFPDTYTIEYSIGEKGKILDLS